MQYISTIIQISVFVSGLVVFGIRIEHRLTKIETDVSWLKQKSSTTNCSKEKEKV